MEVRINETLMTMFRQSPCVVCGKRPCHISLILPIESGGSTEYFNLMPLCVKHCHEHNARQTIELSNKYINVKRYVISKGWEFGKTLSHRDLKGSL